MFFIYLYIWFVFVWYEGVITTRGWCTCNHETNSCIYMQVALAYLSDYYINLSFEWVPNMLEHDNIRVTRSCRYSLTHRDTRVTHCCCRLYLWYECTAEGLTMLNIFAEREKTCQKNYVFVSVWKSFYKYLLYVSVPIHGLYMSMQWWSYHASIRGEYKKMICFIHFHS